MAGDTELSHEWFGRAAERYRESFPLAPPGSWGRPIGILKARILAADWSSAEADAAWTLEQGAAESTSPIGRYAATLALLTLGRFDEARREASSLRERDDFPQDVADALAFIAAHDVVAYAEAAESVLTSFETRDEYLEAVPVADTVLVLQVLAARRGIAADLPESPVLPA